MGILSPGQATTYKQWQTLVKQWGGAPVTMPHDNGSVPGAKYFMTTWVPYVNAGTWPQPDDYSANGQWAYYRAPQAVIADAQNLTVPTSDETTSYAYDLSQAWNAAKDAAKAAVPTLGIGAALVGVGIVAAVLLYKKL